MQSRIVDKHRRVSQNRLAVATVAYRGGSTETQRRYSHLLFERQPFPNAIKKNLKPRSSRE